MKNPIVSTTAELVNGLEATAAFVRDTLALWSDVAFEGCPVRLVLDQLQFLLEPDAVVAMRKRSNEPRAFFGTLTQSEIEKLFEVIERPQPSSCLWWNQYQHADTDTEPILALFDEAIHQQSNAKVIAIHQFHYLSEQLQEVSWLLVYTKGKQREARLMKDLQIDETLQRRVSSAMEQIAKSVIDSVAIANPQNGLHYDTEQITSDFLGTSVDIVMEKLLSGIAPALENDDIAWAFDLFVRNTKQSCKDKVLLRRIITPKQRTVARFKLGNGYEEKLRQIELFGWTERTSVVGKVAISGCAVFCPELDLAIRATRSELEESEHNARILNRKTLKKLRPTTRSAIVVPLFSERQIVGAIQINSPGITTKDERLRTVRKLCGLHHSMTLARELDPKVKLLILKVADYMTGMVMRSLLHHEKHFLSNLTALLRTPKIDQDNPQHARLMKSLMATSIDRLDFANDMMHSQSLISVSDEYLAEWSASSVEIKDATSEVFDWIDTTFAKEAELISVVDLPENHEFRVPLPRAAFKRILFNLVANSIHHHDPKTRRKTVVGVEIRLSNEGRQALIVTVRDHGGGIREEIGGNAPDAAPSDPEGLLRYMMAQEKTTLGVGRLVITRYVAHVGGTFEVRNIDKGTGQIRELVGRGTECRILLPISN